MENKISSAERKSVVINVLAPLLLVEFAIVIAIGWMLGDAAGLHFGSWQIAEWLINYQGGFVRRGLAGQLIYFLGNGQYLLQVLYVATIVLYVVYACIFVGIYFLAKVKNVKVLILAILVPGSLFQMGMTIQFFTRKEILFLILFGVLCVQYLWMQSIKSKQLQVSKRQTSCQLSLFFGMAIVGGALMTLVHEGYLFMSYPLTLLLLWIVVKEYPESTLSKWGLGIYAVTIPLLFMLCATYRGDAAIAQVIWESISLNDRLALASAAPYTAFGPIASLGWGLQQNLLTIYGLFVTGGWVWWLLFILGNGSILGFIANSHEQQQHTRYCRMVLIGVLISSGMFLIAADWGRWIAYITNSMMLFIFTLRQSSYAQGLAEHRASTNKSFWSSLFLSPILFWLCLIYAIIFRLPECCANPDYLLVPYKGIFGGLF